jgi:hypothetical protein
MSRLHSDPLPTARLRTEGHVLEPGLDGLERLGEAVGHVVVLGDVHGGDVEVRDPVLELLKSSLTP